MSEKEPKPKTQYHVSESLKGQYDDVLDAAKPYLETFDEIYVIGEADIEVISKQIQEMSL